MTSDLELRLHRYRSRLDDAIADDVAGRDAPLRQRQPNRRSLVGAAAIAIVAAGVGALAWTATKSSDSSEQSIAPAMTTALAEEPSPSTDAPTAITLVDNTPIADASSQELAPWPTDVDRQSVLEQEIDVPGSTEAAFRAYLDRASQLVSRCMSEAGFAYRDGDAVNEPAANERLNNSVEIDGENIDGGCRHWSETLAFPGNYFGQVYQDIEAEGRAHPQYQSVVEAYDLCLASAGFPGRPDITGLSDAEIEQLHDRFNTTAMECDSRSSLSEINRALEIFVGDTLTARFPDEVNAYVGLLRAHGVLAG